MSYSSLARKLMIKPGLRIAVWNPPVGYLDELGVLPEIGDTWSAAPFRKEQLATSQEMVEGARLGQRFDDLQSSLNEP